MFHRSERLLLRPVFEEDWQEIFHGINDEGIVRMLAAPPWPFREEHAREFVSRPRLQMLPDFVITLPERDGAPIVGCIGFGDSETGAELGYWIARPFWGRGYATEAGRGVIAIARMLGHRRLHAGHAIDNPASGKVLRKLGFRPTGEVRNQFSKGRGQDAMVCRYVNELEAAAGDNDPPEMCKAA